MVNVVRQAHQLLDRFLEIDAQQNSQGASDVVVELEALIDELRKLRPPGPFRHQK
jgi:hypothetical protein